MTNSNKALNARKLPKTHTFLALHPPSSFFQRKEKKENSQKGKRVINTTSHHPRHTHSHGKQSPSIPPFDKRDAFHYLLPHTHQEDQPILAPRSQEPFSATWTHLNCKPPTPNLQVSHENIFQSFLFVFFVIFFLGGSLEIMGGNEREKNEVFFSCVCGTGNFERGRGDRDALRSTRITEKERCTWMWFIVWVSGPFWEERKKIKKLQKAKSLTRTPSSTKMYVHVSLPSSPPLSFSFFSFTFTFPTAYITPSSHPLFSFLTPTSFPHPLQATLIQS